MVDLAISASITPPSVHQARTHPAERAAAVAPVTVHHAEKLFSILDGSSIAREWIVQLPRGWVGSARPDVRLVGDRWRDRPGVLRAAAPE